MPEQEKDEDRKFRIKVLISSIEAFETQRKFGVREDQLLDPYNEASFKAFIAYTFPVLEHDKKQREAVWTQLMDILDGNEPRPTLGESEAFGMGR